MTRTLILIIFLSALLPIHSFAEDSVGIVQSHPAFCDPGLHRQPNSPFSIMLFCEGALSSYLGVIYEGTMANPLDGNWSLADRFWQDPEWASDVTSYIWDFSGKYLLVATSPIYGSGKVFRLNLKERTSKVIWAPPASCKGECMVELISISEVGKLLKLKIRDWEGNELDTVTVNY